MAIANFVAGWILGAKVGDRGMEEVRLAARSILESKEFSDFASALRTQMAYVLRELSDLVDTDQGVSPDDDVIETVRKLIQRRDRGATSAPHEPNGGHKAGDGALATLGRLASRSSSASGQ